jgi:hypothetical protein
VAAEVIAILRTEAQSRGLTLEQLWEELVGQEAVRTCQHLEKN